jgi:hypothetical protein
MPDSRWPFWSACHGTFCQQRRERRFSSTPAPAGASSTGAWAQGETRHLQLMRLGHRLHSLNVVPSCGLCTHLWVLREEGSRTLLDLPDSPLALVFRRSLFANFFIAIRHSLAHGALVGENFPVLAESPLFPVSALAARSTCASDFLLRLKQPKPRFASPFTPWRISRPQPHLLTAVRGTRFFSEQAQVRHERGLDGNSDRSKQGKWGGCERWAMSEDTTREAILKTFFEQGYARLGCLLSPESVRAFQEQIALDVAHASGATNVSLPDSRSPSLPAQPPSLPFR